MVAAPHRSLRSLCFSATYHAVASMKAMCCQVNSLNRCLRSGQLPNDSCKVFLTAERNASHAGVITAQILLRQARFSWKTTCDKSKLDVGFVSEKLRTGSVRNTCSQRYPAVHLRRMYVKHLKSTNSSLCRMWLTPSLSGKSAAP